MQLYINEVDFPGSLSVIDADYPYLRFNFRNIYFYDHNQVSVAEFSVECANDEDISGIDYDEHARLILNEIFKGYKNESIYQRFIKFISRIFSKG